MRIPSKACRAIAVVVTLPTGQERFLIKVTRVRVPPGKGVSGPARWKVARVLTAWSLAGATLYLPEDTTLLRILDALAADQRTFRTVDVLVAEAT